VLEFGAFKIRKTEVWLRRTHPTSFGRVGLSREVNLRDSLILYLNINGIQNDRTHPFCAEYTLIGLQLYLTK
jgi:hypothetical protein